MNQFERPLHESYWVEADRFLAGEYPGAEDEFTTRKRLTALLNAGFDTFIDLTGPGELQPYQPLLAEEAQSYGMQVACLRFPIGDFGLPGREQMVQILDSIDSALAAGHRIYLHCWGGIGRTGTTVGCYLVRHGRTGLDALHHLSELWKGVPKSDRHPRSPETPAQVDFILNWDELA
jgi:hypothetical protein